MIMIILKSAYPPSVDEGGPVRLAVRSTASRAKARAQTFGLGSDPKGRHRPKAVSRFYIDFNQILHRYYINIT